MKTRFCLFTNDVETTSITNNSLNDETGMKVFKEGMPALLELYAKHKIRATFFFTGYIAKLIPDVVKMIVPYGHEVASHGLRHEPQYSFDNLSFDEQKVHLFESKKILEDITGNEIITFRAPAARVQKNTTLALAETGFSVDSSISSQRFDFFLSFGNLQKLRWLSAPRNPYFTAQNDIFKRGQGKILEIPISALVVPYIGTTLRIFPNSIKLVRSLLDLESSISGKPIVFLTHPNEFIQEKDNGGNTKRRAQNFFSYLFGDIIRRRLKLKNLGPGAISLLEKEIKYFNEKGYKFLTCKDYYSMKKNIV